MRNDAGGFTAMNFIYNLDFVGVPSDFIESIMPKANGSFVKVYLYALNAAVHGRSVSCQDIANALELLESDVMKAFEYLEENGCLKMNGESCSFGEMPETVQTAENEKTEDIPEEDSSGKKAAEMGMDVTLSPEATIDSMIDTLIGGFFHD